MKYESPYEETPAEVREALRHAKIVPDFLPPPEQLVPREETSKITIALSKDSIAWFKHQAKASRVPYQLMMRRVLDLYVRHWSSQS